MKKLTYAIIALVLSLCTIHACKIDPATNAPVSATTGELGATKLNLPLNNLDTVSVINPPSGAIVTWSVSPGGYGDLTPVGNSALIHFTNSGTYTVSAVVNGGTPLTIVITVTPPTRGIPANGPVLHFPLTGDEITLVPSLHTGPVVDSVYIYFTGWSLNTYPCGSSQITYTQTLSSSNAFSINFVDVMQPSVCKSSSGPAQITTPIAFTQNPSNQYLTGIGTYPLTITLNGTTYTGNITVTTTTITVNWTYTTGVLMTRKVITR